MSIKKQVIKTKPVVKVTFSIEAKDANAAAVVGDFNNWNPAEGSKEYCSWDSATERACSHHDYEKGLIHLVHSAGAEIYPSIGGWTLSDAFSALAASATARAAFAQNCINLILDYEFDGNLTTAF